MKKLLSSIVIASMVSIAIISCINTGNRDNTNQNEDTFNPGQDYKLVWSDEFRGDAIDTNNWNFQVEEAGRFNDEWQRYTNSSENAYIDNGCLVIKAIHESNFHAMDQYTSARMNTAHKQSWKYGKIVARIKLPYGIGIWPAFWMLGENIDENGGDTPWPQAGEIDILELYGSRNDSVVEANIHYADASGAHASMGAASYKISEGRFADAFHIFEFDWDSTRVAWVVNGVEYASTPITDQMEEFHKEFFILLNIAVGNIWAGRPNANSVFPQYMYVDWVRVYQKKDK